MVAVILLETVPAKAVNETPIEPDRTRTDAGTTSVGELLNSVTITPPEPAACDNATAQEAAPAELRLAGRHDTEFNAEGEMIGIANVMVTVLERPL